MIALSSHPGDNNERIETKQVLNIAMAYGSREEIADAFRRHINDPDLDRKGTDPGGLNR